jgi:four helix bundle protein
MMTGPTRQRTYDLEDRTWRFARDTRDFVKVISRTRANAIYTNQLLRSSSSVGANYIEANDAIGKYDFVMKLRICRRESRESALWLRLLETTQNWRQECERLRLLDEAMQLVRIFSAIVQNTLTNRNPKGH